MDTACELDFVTGIGGPLAVADVEPERSGSKESPDDRLQRPDRGAEDAHSLRAVGSRIGQRQKQPFAGRATEDPVPRDPTGPEDVGFAPRTLAVRRLARRLVMGFGPWDAGQAGRTAVAVVILELAAVEPCTVAHMAHVEAHTGEALLRHFS
jgi:hypothetical protein